MELSRILRFVEPTVEPARILGAPGAYRRFARDLREFRRRGGRAAREDLHPRLHDWTPTSAYDTHYFFQDSWAAREVAALSPPSHVDVGSRVDYVAFLTAVTDVIFVDIRPLEVDLPRFSSITGSLLALPFEDQSLASLSCLHVAEHVGLGRYGDGIDPEGTDKAMAELQRVVAPGGQLLFSGPVGRPRVCFNAHRVHDPVTVVERFGELRLEAFAGVDDAGRFHSQLRPEDLRGADYACGLYRFVRLP